LTATLVSGILYGFLNNRGGAIMGMGNGRQAIDRTNTRQFHPKGRRLAERKRRGPIPELKRRQMSETPSQPDEEKEKE